MIEICHSFVSELLNGRVLELEKYFGGDVIFYYGEIHPDYLTEFRDFLEDLKEGNRSKRKAG